MNINYDDDKRFIERNINENGIIEIDDKVINILYNDINEGFNYVTQNKCSPLKIDSETINIETGTYFPLQIHNYIKTHTYKYYKSTCKINNKKISIIFCFENKDFDIEYLNGLILCIATIIYICNKYSRKNCSKTLKVIIFLNDFKKQLPSNSTNIIGPINVNTGFTEYCSANNEIIIYRSEEWFKVFIHEAFHAFGLEGGLEEYNFNEIKDLFNIETSVLLSETYVELWARILNSSINAFLNTSNIHTFSIKLKENLSIEQQFSAIQAVKILNYMGLTYNDIINKLSYKGSLMYKEKSNVFAYYILSSIFFSDINGFLLYCLKYNKSGIIKFNADKLYINEILDLIKQNYKSKKYYDLLLNVKKQSTQHNGLRMSLVDI